MDQDQDQDRLPDADQAPTRPRDPEDGLGERDREAQRQDVAADARDEEARDSDAAAGTRDREAEQRDRSARSRDDAAFQDDVPAYASARRHARHDREQAASDRAQAVDDRGRARRDRKTSKQERNRASGDRSATWEAMARFRMLLSDAEANAQDMHQIGEAQGVLIRHGDLTPTEALAEIFTRAAHETSSLGEAATRIVAETSR